GTGSDVYFPYPLERKMIDVVPDALSPMMLVHPDILQVEEDTAVGILGHTSHKFPIRQFIAPGLQIADATFQHDRHGYARRQRFYRQYRCLDPGLRLSRGQQKSRVPSGIAFADPIETQMLAQPR